MASLWNIPDAAGAKTPLSMMKEQARFLTSETDGVLKGTVETSGSNDRFVIELQIEVPRLSNYLYSLLKYTQPMPGLYPGYLHAFPTKIGNQIGNEGDFEKALQEALSSQKTTEVLLSLIAQADS